MYHPDNVDSILKKLNADLRETLGDKVESLILFGSYSRGNYTKYSDIDLLILVKDSLRKEETQFIDNLIACYSLKNDVVISGLVYPAEIYHQFNTPFLLNVKEEGIPV